MFKTEGNNPKNECSRQEIDTILVKEESESPASIVGEESPRRQLETNATINYMECQELEAFATPIEIPVSMADEVIIMEMEAIMYFKCNC